MSREALIVVDPQQRFTLPGAPFEVAESQRIVEDLERFAAEARQQGVPVIWLTREIREAVGPGKRTGSTYDISNFIGKWAEIDHRLTVAEGDIHITKPRHSGFFGTDLESVLRQLDIEDLLICGFTINVCCLATAVDAVARDFGAILLRDLSGARAAGTPEAPISAEEMHQKTCDLFQYGLGTLSHSTEVRERWG